MFTSYKNKNNMEAKHFNNFTADPQGWHRNTDLGCELKTVLRSDKRMKTEKNYRGMLCRDAEAVLDDFLSRDAHYTFVETAPSRPAKRNPRVFCGRLINVTRWDDGSLHPIFRPMPQGMSADNYAIEVYLELRSALRGLIEEWPA